MASFPNLSAGTPFKYPLTRSVARRGEIYVHEDMSEQRSPLGVALNDFNAVWNDIKKSDKELLRNFFNAQQGSFATTWSLTFQDPPGTSVTYHNLQFTPGQKFQATNVSPTQWQVTLKMRQVFPG